MNTTHTPAILRTLRRLHKSRGQSTMRRSILAAGIAALLCGTPPVFAGSATWNLVPLDNNWNSAVNWTPGGPPNGAGDTARFDVSGTTAISLTADTEVNGIVFNAGASPFTITASPTFTLTISGTGITNSSGITQNFVAATNGASEVGSITFNNASTAGSLTAFATSGMTTNLAFSSRLTFNHTSNAGSAAITNHAGTVAGGSGGTLTFNNSSNGGTATITNHGATVAGAYAGRTTFNDTSNAGSAVINNHAATAAGALGSGSTTFDTASAGSATIINHGAAFAGSFQEGTTTFQTNATAASANITNTAGTVATARGGGLLFGSMSTAGGATITNGGSALSGALPGTTVFAGGSAGTSTIINNGGSASGAAGGETLFDLTIIFGGGITFTTATGANSTITNGPDN